MENKQYSDNKHLKYKFWEILNTKLSADAKNRLMDKWKSIINKATLYNYFNTQYGDMFDIGYMTLRMFAEDIGKELDEELTVDQLYNYGKIDNQNASS